MIYFSPSATVEYSQQKLLEKGVKHNNYYLSIKDSHYYAYKNGVDMSEEFIKECGSIGQYFPVCQPVQWSLIRDYTHNNKPYPTNHSIIKKLANDSNINLFCYNDFINIKAIYKNFTYINNNVVNPYLLLTSVRNCAGKNKYSENFFISCVEQIKNALFLKSVGYMYNKLTFENICIYDKRYDVLNNPAYYKERAHIMNICTHFPYGKRTINILKEFGYDDPLQW